MSKKLDIFIDKYEMLCNKLKLYQKNLIYLSTNIRKHNCLYLIEKRFKDYLRKIFSK